MSGRFAAARPGRRRSRARGLSGRSADRSSGGSRRPSRRPRRRGRAGLVGSAVEHRVDLGRQRRSAPGRRAPAVRAGAASRPAAARARPPRAAGPAAPARPGAPGRGRQQSPRPGASGRAPRRTARRGPPTERDLRPDAPRRRRPRAAAGSARAVARYASATRREPAAGRGARGARPAGVASSTTSAVRWRAAASGGELAVLARLAGAGGVDLGDHRGHPGDEHPLLGRAHDGPAALDRPAGIGDVAAPQRERRGREVVRAGQLRLAQRVELEHRLAEQPRRRLAGIRLDLDDRQLQDADRGRRRRPAASSSRVRADGRASGQRPSRKSDSTTLPARKLP